MTGRPSFTPWVAQKLTDEDRRRTWKLPPDVSVVYSADGAWGPYTAIIYQRIGMQMKEVQRLKLRNLPALITWVGETITRERIGV